ncbi:MAG: mannose-6-phosphate isomerase, class I [Microbacteriaceae bacterium]
MAETHPFSVALGAAAIASVDDAANRWKSAVFVEISNTPRDYAWGSSGRISALLGDEPTDQLEAELWLGAHPGSPAQIDSDDLPHDSLDAWIAADTRAALGHLTQLPYLLKVLAADEPLSLQVHPTREYAAVRFADEDRAGIPRDASNRNYRDANHKPEMVVALEDGFAALCGVRPEAERLEIVAELGVADELDARNVRQTLDDLLSNRGSARVTELVERVVAATAAHTGSRHAESYRWAGELNRFYPGDPGVVLSLLLNLVTLNTGEALFLPAGNLHAYLHGIGLEVMAASDNVLRGGLTPKRIDVPELLAVVDTTALPLPLVQPVAHGDALIYRGAAAEFELVVVRGEAPVPLTGPAIVLNLGAQAELHGAHSSAQVERGHALFVTADEGELWVRGEHVVVAQPQAHWVETFA